MADMHGNVVHLHERDCSLQRRHQKVLEEAPASDLDPSLRRRLGEAAVRAARAVQCINAGTVEFLLDTQSSDFYFCEMNTRLQVEHPVTEVITGLDLVEWQLRIAAGETLPILHQEEIPCVGHAFEARVYAENPTKAFLPSTGRVLHHVPPTTFNEGLDHEEGIRVDSGIQKGSDISVYYDPMISKLIVHGRDRPDALRRLVKALREYQIVGVDNNLPFLRHCAQHPAFAQEGPVHTGFLDLYMDDVRTKPMDPSSYAMAAWIVLLHLENRQTPTAAT